MMLSCVILILVIVLVNVLHLLYKEVHQEGGYISPLSGPVDMLQSPKQLLMDGYRFQDVLFPPDPSNHRTVSYLCPSDRQRVGVFKEKAYITEGFTSPSPASLLQISARGEQDQYLMGHSGDHIIDSDNPFGQWVEYAPPEVRREVNYPNQAFSWGDIANRYGGQSPP